MADAAVATPPAAPTAPDIDTQEASLIASNDAARADLSKQRDAEMAPIERSVKDAAGTIDRLAGTPTQQIPLPENAAKHLDPKQLNDAASAFMTLGALAGLLSRQPMTAALNNMTAAMKGVQEGDAEQYDRSYKEFTTNYDKAMKTNKAMLDEKEKVLKDTQLSLTARMEQMRLIDVKYGNIGKDMKGSFDSRMKLFEAQRKATQHAEDQREKIDLAHERMTQARQMHEDSMALRRELSPNGSGGSGSGLSDDARAMFADMQMRGIKPPDISGRKEVSREKVAVANLMAAKYKQDGTTPSDTQVDRDMQAGLAKAMSQVQSRVSGIELGSRKIEKDIKTIDSYIQEGSPDHAKIVNKFENKLRDAASDPTLAPYALAVKQVATEYERLLQGGMLSVAQLHSGAAQDAKGILNENMSIAEVNAVIPVMLREIDNQKQASHETLADLKAQIRGVGGAPAGKPAAPGDGQTATNPKTGEKLVKKNGQWVPA